MTRFNPNDNAGGDSGGSSDGRTPTSIVPPNDYLLAMVGLYRKTGQKPPHRPYLNCRYRVIHGEQEGAEFYSSLGIDTSNHNIAKFVYAANHIYSRHRNDRLQVVDIGKRTNNRVHKTPAP